MTTDTNILLRDYAEHGSEEAFTELVRRYMDFVHSAALRQMGGNASLAEEVAQLVFTDLARQAPRLQAGSQLGGWLHRHTVFVAGKLRRAEARRGRREQHSPPMNDPEPPVDWGAVAPLLDEAVDSLSEPDRQAIVLRYFEQKDLRSLGASLGVSEDAAQKRVARAVERLRQFFARRGATISAASLMVCLGERTVVTTAAAVAARVALNSLAGAGATLTGVGTLSKIMAYSKAKAAVVGLFLGAGIAMPLWQQREIDRLRADLEAHPAASAHPSRGDMEQERAAEQAELERLRASQLELARLRGEVGKLRAEAALAAGKGGQDASKAKSEEVPAGLGGDEPAIRTFTSSVTRRVEAGGAVITGGWQTQPGKRAMALVSPSAMEDGSGNVKVVSRWIEMPDRVFEQLGLTKADSASSSWGENLDAATMASLLATLEKSDGVELLSAPAITTASGRQGRVSVTESKEINGQTFTIGPSIDLVPTLTADGKAVDIQISTQLNLPTADRAN